MNSDRESARHGPDEPNDLNVAAFIDDAALVARIRASYAGAPSPEAAQVARCTTAVLAEALRTPTHRFGGALRPRWWWGAAAAALLVVSVMRPWQPEVAVQRADQAFVGAAPLAAHGARRYTQHSAT